MKNFTNLAQRAFKKCASLGTINKKRYYLFIITMLLTLGAGTAWGADVTETITMKGFAGITSSGYQNFTKTGSSDKGTAMVAYAYNGETGQVRGNKTTVAGASVTTEDKNKNWSLYNSQAMGGAIKSITITQTATGNNKFQNEMYVSLGTTSQGAVTTITNAQKHTSLTTSTIQFDIDPTKGYTYFKLLSTKQFTSNSVAGVEVKVTYETASGGETPEPEPDPTPDPEEPGTGGEETWTLVTNASNLKAVDQVVIAASGYDYAMASQNGNYRNRISITKDGNDITINNDVQILTVEEGTKSNTYAFNTGSGYLYACSSSNNYLKTQATNNDNGSWTITITNTGEATLVAQGSYTHNMIQYNATSGSERFSCYATDKPQKPVSIYKKVTSIGGSDPEPVIVKTLQSIAVSGMTIKYETGDEFKFDGTCTATYSVTKNGEPQTVETATVIPTSVSTPDMSTAGTKEVTVTYSEGEITRTIPYEITVENALPKIVITQEEVADFTNTYAEYTWIANGISGKIYGYKNSGMQLNSSKDGSYVYNTDPIPGYIRKIKIVKASGTTRKWTPFVSGTALTSADGTALEQKEVETTTTWEVDGETSYFYLLESGGATVIESITIYYEAVVPQVAAPTFTPAAGTYNAVQNVTISAEEGATIYYTLDGTTPSTESQVYSTPIEIAETKTLKAIAVKDEKVSPVASATYTIKLPLTTMDQIFAKATEVSSTATSVEITFGNWVVSAVKEDGKTAFVTDGTKGFVIFDKDVNLGFSVGNILSGTATCKVQLYNGFAELTELKSNTAGLSVVSGGTITTQELDATAIETLTGVNTGSLIKINGICSSTESKYYVAGVQIYTALYDFETLKVGAEYNITGIYQQFHSTKEMLPRSEADIEEVVGLPTATISIADITMEVGQEKAIEATITPDAAQSTVQYVITSGSEYITLDGTTITAIAAGEATITATIAEVAGEYYGATKTFTVTVKPQNIAVLPFTFNGGKADIENTLGMSHHNLDDDYNSAPKLKFNGAGDNVIIHFDSQAGEFSFLLKQNGQNAGTFTVFESANGEDYTPIWSGGNIGNTKSETITPTLAESSRYVKFEYTTKGEGTNYALGSISIAKPDLRQEAGLAWSVESVILNQGDEFTAPTLSNDNGLTLTCSSTDESVATVTSEGVITLAGAIGTTTITASFAGNEYYKAAEVSCKITVNKAQLPTGTFALYSGDIVEGDYVITYENYAMNTTSSAAPRLQYQEVTPTENKLVNPANQIVWHIAADGEYWTLYNNYDEVYAVSTGVKNQATTAAEVTDNAKWSITGIEAYDITNLNRENGSDSDNKYLRKNEDYGFACYKETTGGSLTLYRKQTQHTVTVAACTNGSVSASGVVDTKVLSGDIITLSNTPEFDYQFVGYNVYKTGDETTVITVTNGTFTMPAFDVTISATFEAIQPTTAKSGKFSTGKYEYAEFATGNLQYNNGTGDWRFAKQQYQYVGKDNIYVGKEDYKGWIDLFGWSADDKFGVNPSNDNTNYQGEFVDWGTLFLEEGWSTLSKNQWNYLLNERTNAASLKQIAMVGETLGIMLFPDEWTLPAGCAPTKQTHHDEEDGEDHSCDFVSYNYTLAQWTELEKAGAVFLPAAGRRTGGWGNKTISPHMIGKAELDADDHYKHYADYYAYYWTSTKTDGKVNYLINCTLVDKVKDTYTVHAGHVNWAEEARYGQSVRLAKVTSTAYTRTVTNGNYGTICLPYASASTTGAYFYEVAGKEEGKVYLASVDALEAGVPYIFEATAGTITVTYQGEAANEAGTANGLVGTFVETTVPDGDYILYNNAFCTNEDAGTLNKIKENRAYLDMDAVTGGAPVQMPGRRYIGMSVQGENEATGFENITNGENITIKTIENGQLIIIRNGEKFNAQGQRL